MPDMQTPPDFVAEARHAMNQWMIRARTGSSTPEIMAAVERLPFLRSKLTAQQAWDLSRAHLGVTAAPGTDIVGYVGFEGMNEVRKAYVQGYSEFGLMSYAGPQAMIGVGTRMGRYCSIAMNATVGPGEHTPSWLTTHNFARNKPAVKPESEATIGNQRLIIGHDVWIGANAFVATDITIGTGAVIGAGAVVVKDVAPYSIVVGNPARVMRLRFPEKTIARLLVSEWWRLPVDHVATLPFDDIDRAVGRAEELRGTLSASALI